MSDPKTDKAAPIPVELPLSQTTDGKATPDRAIGKPVPEAVDDPAVASLADSVNANA